MSATKDLERQFRPGDIVTVRPVNFYNVLFVHEDGRVQVMNGKGGGSFAIKPEELDLHMTDVETVYWKEEGLKMKDYLEKR
jgi:hypothetical protein